MIKKCSAKAAKRISELIASLLMRSAIKPLLDIDERSLFDVGLSRSDLVECLSMPISTNPAKFLTSRAKRRGPVSDLEVGMSTVAARPARPPLP